VGMSSLNVYGRISAQEKRITTLDIYLKMRISARYTRDGVIAGVKLTNVYFKGKYTAKFLSTTENVA
jgi:hypothetical protein